MIDKKNIIIIVISILGIVVSCSLLIFNKQKIMLGNVTNEYQYIAEINNKKIFIKYDEIRLNNKNLKDVLYTDNTIIEKIIKKSDYLGMAYDGGTKYYKSKDISGNEYYIVICNKGITEDKVKDIYITNDINDNKLCSY